MSINVPFTVILTGIALIFFGIWGIVAPKMVTKWVRHVSKQGGYVLATGVRFGLAFVFYLAAPRSKVPEVMLAFAVIVGLAAVVLMLIGFRRYSRWVRKWRHQPHWAIRLQMLLLMAFGGSLIWLLS